MAMEKPNELKVFISNRNAICDDCKEALGKKAWITLEREKGALCLSCSDLDHLVFLPSGSAALTRRSKKYSTLSVVVLQFSKSRRRYERQGLLVEMKALEKAEKECLADEDVRARRRERAAEQRVIVDKAYVNSFAERILHLYPSCPPKQAIAIAKHACQKYSGRVGRSAAAKNLEAATVKLAMIAHIRHAKTDYDKLLSQGYERQDARRRVQGRIEEVLREWETEG